MNLIQRIIKGSSSYPVMGGVESKGGFIHQDRGEWLPLRSSWDIAREDIFALRRGITTIKISDRHNGWAQVQLYYDNELSYRWSGWVPEANID